MANFEFKSVTLPVLKTAEDLGGLPWQPCKEQNTFYEGDLVMHFPEGLDREYIRQPSIVLKCHTETLDIMQLGLNRMVQGVPHYADQKLTKDSVRRAGVVVAIPWVEQFHQFKEQAAEMRQAVEEVRKIVSTLNAELEEAAAVAPSEQSK